MEDAKSPAAPLRDMAHIKRQDPFLRHAAPASFDESRYSLPTADELLAIPDAEKVHFLRSFHQGMASSTKDFNALVEQYGEVLDQIVRDQDEARSPQLRRLSGTDCGSRLSKASLAIKAIKYQCNNTVAAEADRVAEVTVRPKGDGAPGPPCIVDLIEGCQVYCRINVKGRKQPLRIGLRVDGQPPSIQRCGELALYLTDAGRDPTPEEHQKRFLNPGGRIMVRDLRGVAEDPRSALTRTSVKAVQQAGPAPADDPELFAGDWLYICCVAAKGCSLTLSCQFTAEDDGKPKAKRAHATNKVLRGKFEAEVSAKADELFRLASDPELKAAYVSALRTLQRQMKKMRQSAFGTEGKPGDPDFQARNVELAGDFNYLPGRQAEGRQLDEWKSMEAKERRDRMEADRIKKLKFEMLKWDLYRLRVEKIEDDYADFKRLQKKIGMWNHIILRDIAVRKVIARFYEHKAAVEWEIRRNKMQAVIGEGFKRYLLRRGATRLARFTHWIRDGLTFLHHSFAPRAQEGAAVHLAYFLSDTADTFDTANVLRAFHGKVVRVQGAVRHACRVRILRIRLIDGFFEKERSIMVKHYETKMKKQKKLRSLVAALRGIAPQAKQLVLQTYYMNKIVSQNLTAAVHYHANMCLVRGDRGQPGDPAHGLLTDLEQRNLKQLKRNINGADQFLFKGVKEVAAVGNPSDEQVQIIAEPPEFAEGIVDVKDGQVQGAEAGTYDDVIAGPDSKTRNAGAALDAGASPLAGTGGAEAADELE